MFDLSIGEDYYRPIIVNSAFNNNYVIYESKGDKEKILTLNEYLDMIMFLEANGKFEWSQSQQLCYLTSKTKSPLTKLLIMHIEKKRISVKKYI